MKKNTAQDYAYLLSRMPIFANISRLNRKHRRMFASPRLWRKARARTL